MENIENNNLKDNIDQGTSPCNVLDRHPKKRNRAGLFVLITITVLFLFTGIGLGIFFGVKNRKPIGLDVTIDPQIISSNGSITHTYGAMSFTFDGKEPQKEYSSNFQYDIQPDNYMKIVYSFENNGETDTKYKLEFYDTSILNITFNYQLNNGGFTPCNQDSMDWVEVKSGESSQLCLYMKIINKSDFAAYRGFCYLILMEVSD